MNISISKIRSLPYHERIRFIFLLPDKHNVLAEVFQLLSEYPQWDHEQLEQLIIDNDLTDINVNIYTQAGINTWRMITYLCSKDNGKDIHKLTDPIVFTLLSWSHETKIVCIQLLFTTLFDNYTSAPHVKYLANLLNYCVAVKQVPLYIDSYMNNILSQANDPEGRKLIKHLLPYVKGPEMIAYINDCLSISDIIC